jgi:hypothetical protein
MKRRARLLYFRNIGTEGISAQKAEVKDVRGFDGETSFGGYILNIILIIISESRSH